VGPDQQYGGLWLPLCTKTIFRFQGTNLPKRGSMLS
jgi:hypothetical protein